MATPAKPSAPQSVPPAKKSRKLLFFMIAAVLLIGGGAAAYFVMKPADANSKEEEKTKPAIPPTYVALGKFTANLLREDSSDRYLQVAISIKISKPELEDAIKARNPEILDHVNMLLSSQRPSVLATIAGKQKLARDIKTQIELVLGLSHTIPGSEQTQSASAPAAITSQQPDSGIAEVLFTSFIIQ
jgi:flagellar FliL protein